MKTQNDDIACLILAAGASSRFGSAKMLHPLADGSSILATTIRLYNQVFDNVNVIVGTGDDALISLVTAEGARIIQNPNSDQGLSQSIVAGVKSTSPSRAWLVGLGDMPYLSIQSLQALARDARADKIVVPRTPLGYGNPVIFGRDFKAELIRLKGDIGAKPIIKKNIESIRFYDCDDAGVHQDIDYVSDILTSNSA